jgi:predicted AlkP superfamily pyrophosphatase or phosphodiesterase
MIKIIGIDGLDKSIIERHINELPNFKKISQCGLLNHIESVFPADSVPAWTTIFTGLNPAEHGIIRGKDYIESIEDFGASHGFVLVGKTFWDHLSERGLKCLVINPFLAYPAWEINGIMESGPAFIEGKPSIFPAGTASLHPEILGGYSAISNLTGLKSEMEKVFDDTEKLWKEYAYQSAKEDYDLEFVTFTTLDRLQHYTWRYYDEEDPLHEHNNYLSDCIPQLLRAFDRKLGNLIDKMRNDDILVIVSDHGFRQRPYKVINLNEFLRKKELLIVREEYNNPSVRIIQRLKKIFISSFSHLGLLDLIASRLKNVKSVSKLKKSDHLIDKVHSVCFTDHLFSGKKPYVGLNFGDKIRLSDRQTREKAFIKIKSAITSGEIPLPVWIKEARELYTGEFQSKLPDICIEFTPEYGVEFNYFSEIIEKSSTHHRISGGHFGSGIFGYYSPSVQCVNPPSHIIDFYEFIKSIAV